MMHITGVALAYLPDTGELAHLNVPAHGNALSSDDVQALGVGTDLAGIQRLPHRCRQICLLHIALHIQTCIIMASPAGHTDHVLVALQPLCNRQVWTHCS